MVIEMIIEMINVIIVITNLHHSPPQGDVEQQQSTSVNKETTKAPDDNEIRNRDTREPVESERINELSTSVPSEASVGQQATESRTGRSDDGILSRISPVVICFLIAVIIAKRLYSYFHLLE